jgi:hypothetical protein
VTYHKSHTIFSSVAGEILERRSLRYPHDHSSGYPFCYETAVDLSRQNVALQLKCIFLAMECALLCHT